MSHPSGEATHAVGDPSNASAASNGTSQQQLTRPGLFPPRVLPKSYSIASARPITENNPLSIANEWELRSKAGRSCGVDRVIRSVDPPESLLLSKEMLFSDNGKPNIFLLRTHFLRQGRLDAPAAIQLVKQAKEILEKEPNMLEIEAPVVVCGDIHGQFYDLMTLFDRTRDADKYLFLGDYVDRGDFSTEVLFYLLALKISKPHSVFMLRGNHETRMMSEFMTFLLECEFKYANDELYDETIALFDRFPLCALITGCKSGRFFAVHGGLSPSISKIEEIQTIERFSEPPTSGPLCDLLWADPVDEIPNPTRVAPQEIAEWQKIEFLENKKRQTSVSFGCKGIQNFLENNDLVCVIRAHEVTDDGFKEHRFLTKSEIPLCVTIFSAPNYCDLYENQAAVMVINEQTYQYRQFRAVHHPFFLPDFIDAFSFSVPFLMENLVMMLSEMVIEIKEEDPTSISKEEVEMGMGLEKKAKAMQVAMKARESKERILNRKKQSLLAMDHPNLSLFERAVAMDMKNEQAPVNRRRGHPGAGRELKRQASLKW
eukprot:TRINITY_DN6915_c0_g1_i1.p1 TRINITY_DN6915_c0_g1~~TRINITY_DN6915_c0_g1_i1.p1  ORF type:complete len:551 (+),score=120.39 TRINITY_DN6915_c0_g1_i1:26-1654(+)